MCDPTLDLGEALVQLRDQHGDFTNCFSAGGYSLWVGSGVSRRRFPSVPDLMELLVRKLYMRADTSDEICGYIRALREILGIIHIDMVGLDLESGPDSWDMSDIAQRLSTQYAEVLDVRVIDSGQPRDLIWDLLDLPGIYSDNAVKPDAEHYLIALLFEEGVVGPILTTNWDALIEAAHAEIVESEDHAIKSVASNDELHGAGARTLFKVHGCAVKAAHDRPLYGPFLVASESQITNWGDNDQTRPFKEKAQGLLREFNALFVGLSGQDSNLRRVVEQSAEARERPYPARPPKLAFSAVDVDHRRRSILQRVHRDYEDRRHDIDASACISPCAKPLLGALYVDSLIRKMGLVCTLASDDPVFPPGLTTMLQEWPEQLETELRGALTGKDDLEEAWCRFSLEFPRALSQVTHLYRHQKLPLTDRHYEPLIPGHLAELRRRRDWEQMRLHWLMLAIAAIWHGQAKGYWTIVPGHRGGSIIETASLVLNRGTERFGVILADRADSAKIRLEREEVFYPPDVDHFAIIYPVGLRTADRGRLSVMRALPEAPLGGPWEIWLQELVEQAVEPDALAEALEEEFRMVSGVPC